ncbi:hypothetical protein [Paenibacillus thermotolerans]|uniref:hypothetical protein n=1 Tax=Paenibacillus thermotolerans TaxID=3027807 RepID=UPI002367AEBE|nr:MULTISPECIES: hypothetical protein [unclassified Paenibacillus]
MNEQGLFYRIEDGAVVLPLPGGSLQIDEETIVTKENAFETFIKGNAVDYKWLPVTDEEFANMAGKSVYISGGVLVCEEITGEVMPPDQKIARLEAELQKNKLDQAQANTELFEMMLTLSGGVA